LGIELKKHNYKIWIPNLPGSDKPNAEKYNKFLLKENNWIFNEESIIIGHSSGAVEILSLLQNLPNKTKVKACYLIGSFKNSQGLNIFAGLFKTPFDFEEIRKKSKNFYFIHSDNDPYCPLEHAKYLSAKLDGELIVRKKQKHFSIETMGEIYNKFPFLLDKILEN
jgi:predicted alpha/beta hydrolase family esterase